jgi:hypothetical protein
MPPRRRALGAERLEQKRMLAAELVQLGTFGVTEYIPIVSSGEATAAALGDFNLDGVQDMAFGSSQRRGLLDEEDSVVGIALGDGVGGFLLGVDQNVHDDIVSVIAADLNGDGYDDIVAGGIFRLSVFLSEVNVENGWA